MDWAGLLAQIPLVGIFIWYTLEREKRFTATLDKREELYQKSMEKRDEHYLAALDKISDKLDTLEYKVDCVSREKAAGK